MRICRLRNELPDLLKPRSWQEGSFQYECISAFGGDAAFTAALGAASGDDAAAASVGWWWWWWWWWWCAHVDELTRSF